jgi:hypothetical protein
MRLESGSDRFRSALVYITSQLLHQVRVLREDAALQRVALLARHRRDVERNGGLFVRRLLKLTTVDELHVGDGRSSRLPRILVGEPAPERGEDLRPVVFER